MHTRMYEYGPGPMVVRGQCFPLQLNLSAEIELYPEIETIIDILNSTYGAACTNGREEGGL